MQEMSTIFRLYPDGHIEYKARYSLTPKQAMIAYIQQEKGNFNTWTYPSWIDGIRESTLKPRHFYFDLGDDVIASYPD